MESWYTRPRDDNHILSFWPMPFCLAECVKTYVAQQAVHALQFSEQETTQPEEAPATHIATVFFHSTDKKRSKQLSKKGREREREIERERERERKRGDESHLKIGNLTLVQDMFFQFAFDSTLISRIVWNTNLKLHLRRDASSENALSLNMSQNHLCKFMWWSVVKYFGATHDFKLYIWSYGVGLTQGMHSSFKFEDVWTKIAVFAFWSYHDQKQICIFVAFDFCGEVCWA